MEKKHLIRFLKERKRGAYTWLVEMYCDLVTSMSVTVAMELIKEDLAKESETPVDLHYFSLARAVARFKRKSGLNSKGGAMQKLEFRDSNEIKEGQLGAGKFKLGELKSKLVNDVISRSNRVTQVQLG